MQGPKPVQLSKSILDMKFMKRTKERVLKEQEDAEGKAMYSNEITDEMKKSGTIVFTETSIFNCRNLIEGRLSFGGMNPEIEKLMSNDYTRKKQEVEKRKETDVSDAQMAQEYSTLVNTMANKFSGKKNRNKRKFIKPSEDF
ncbi:M-phase phosphoprotein 6 [Tribolium castaneum]|uniref:M-phase phosphoprotein 6-like Protein n=1 Tax=Tribolium castaneum TaxID=7070 RepID=D6WM96_TRICA|nr:PREDICTED: M-phase phosphoprotein 6 [Tribolium castaneum]EFA03339.1 M-phase phosphoprotein 6-like Protein [Tribolium castaneum]|eukprot:XP_969334.1 PREDICTED: M-phase phosphoprotein 6 [Tribolium castaneum]